jgi:hypothetical protein
MDLELIEHPKYGVIKDYSKSLFTEYMDEPSTWIFMARKKP